MMQTDFLHIIRLRPDDTFFCCAMSYCGNHALWLYDDELEALRRKYPCNWDQPYLILSPECAIKSTKIVVVETGPDYVVARWLHK
jgi:hypothetical protein